MLALVIDTSSAAVTAAVARITDTAVEIVAERIVIDGRGHGEHLAPSIAAAHAAAGVTGADLDAVIAGLGPGPFTGLRVGLVTAAATADALRIPAYGVDSLDGIGTAVAGAPSGDVLVATDARRREIYWAVYRDGRRRADPEVGRPADVRAALADTVVAAAGAGARQYADVLALPVLDPDHPVPLALARSAAERVRSRAPGEVLRPQYLRAPDAVEPASFKTVTA